jgi:hypothetical protein
MLPLLLINFNISAKSVLKDKDRKPRRQRGLSKRPWRYIIQKGQDKEVKALVLQGSSTLAKATAAF